MTSYTQLLDQLNSLADEKYRDFNKKLLNNPSVNVMGVRVPQLRAVAKQFKNDDEVFSFPDEWYEVTFIKLTVASSKKYDEFIKLADYCVSVIDNWASCDCFKANCISSHKQEFLTYINKYMDDGREFYQRYALTTLLHFYVSEEYLDIIFSCLSRADTKQYYVHMGAAWLMAEVLIKFYDVGTAFLKECRLDARTHNKAISKARESYRLSPAQKNNLINLKR